MKILCVCDLAIEPVTMSKMEELEKYGATIEYLYDERMRSVKTITDYDLRAQQHGVDSCEPYPELLERVVDADILVTHMSPITSQVIEAGKNLKYIGILRSSHTNVHTDLCKEKGIHVIESPGRNADGVADFAVGMMISEMRNIARSHSTLLQGQWKKKFDNLAYCHDMRRCTVGIIGAGSIGRKVIKRLQGFECPIIVHDPFMSDDEVRSLGLEPVSLEELLQKSDIVSLHLRLSEKTENFIGEKEFSLMKNTAYFINSARADLVEEAALIKALQEKQIGGAALDVFNVEPLETDSPLLQLDNVTLTAHLAGSSCDSFVNSVEILESELECMFEGKPIPGFVL